MGDKKLFEIKVFGGMAKKAQTSGKGEPKAADRQAQVSAQIGTKVLGSEEQLGGDVRLICEKLLCRIN